LYVFGGYDGKKNHNQITVFNIATKKWSILEIENSPSGWNGHTETLIDGHKVFIIGGWLGSGPFAADDLYILDLEALKWNKCPIRGEPPGPCNMHTSDVIDR
jgi:N-acetylneuraminic acid mutarotase